MTKLEERLQQIKKQKENQVIVLTLVAIVAILFFGYVYLSSSQNSEAREIKDAPALNKGITRSPTKSLTRMPTRGVTRMPTRRPSPRKY